MTERFAIGRAGMRRKQARARWVVASFAAVWMATQAAWSVMLEAGPAALRDPEYGLRESRLRRLISAQPNSELCVAFGSSRLAEGLRPAAIHTANRPCVFNCGLVGAGPVMQRLALDRLLRTGINPSAVLVEFWPPYLFDTIHQKEADRLEANRLNGADRHVFDPYMADAHRDWANGIPVVSQRFTVLNLVLPNWLPFHKRQEFYWSALDEWGWLPGKPAGRDPALRAKTLELSRQYYAPVLLAPRLDATGRRAFDDLIAECRERRIAVGVVWLPESSEFRSWYSPGAERLAQLRFRELGNWPGVQLIDARTWVADERLGDGFHLDPDGATAFTTQLRHALSGLLKYTEAP